MTLSNKNELTLVIATSNTGKLNEFRELLEDFPLNLISQPTGLEVEENGNNFAENARIKAIAASKVTGCWALADDSGLSVDALKGAPGIHSARYANNDQERINKLLKELEFSSNRNAKFIASLCLASFDKVLIQSEGLCKGKITKFPRGENGFGYDPIFEVLGTQLTFAEMGLAKKKSLGHRGKAFEMLKPPLRKLISESLIINN